MLDAVQAVEKSYRYLVNIINFNKTTADPRGLTLEEVEKTNDSHCWKVTFSFEKDGAEPDLLTPVQRVNPFLNLPRKTYMVVTINAEDGSFVSFKGPDS